MGVGVDWGSSNIRAWAFKPNGEIAAKSHLELGLADARSQGFDGVFEQLKSQMQLPPQTMFVACGMNGAIYGWVHLPYITCPAAAPVVQASAIDAKKNDLWVLPGLSTSDGVPDVMRGEETQICGAIALGHSGLMCLPGTHLSLGLRRLQKRYC